MILLDFFDADNARDVDGIWCGLKAFLRSAGVQREKDPASILFFLDLHSSEFGPR